MSKKIKKFHKIEEGKIIFGVCTGLGEYFSIDPVFLRALFVVLSFANGFGVILYLVLAAVSKTDKK